MRTVLTNDMIDRAALTVPLSDEHYDGLLLLVGQHLDLHVEVVNKEIEEFLSQATYAEISGHDAVRALKEKLVSAVEEAKKLRAARVAEVMTCVKASTPVCQYCTSLAVEYTIDSRWKIVRAGQRCPNLTCRQVIMWQPPSLYHFNWFAKTWVPKTQRFDESSGHQVPIGENEITAFLSGVGGVHAVITELLGCHNVSLSQLLSGLKIKAPSDAEEAAQLLWSISGKYFGYAPYLYNDTMLNQAVLRAKKIEPPVWEGNTTVVPEVYTPSAAVPELIPGIPSMVLVYHEGDEGAVQNFKDRIACHVLMGKLQVRDVLAKTWTDAELQEEFARASSIVCFVSDAFCQRADADRREVMMRDLLCRIGRLFKAGHVALKLWGVPLSFFYGPRNDGYNGINWVVSPERQRVSGMTPESCDRFWSWLSDFLLEKTHQEHNRVRQFENRRTALANRETRLKVYSELLSMHTSEFEGVLRSLNLAQARLTRVQGRRELELINMCENRGSFGELFDTIMNAG